jgi:hypothetical protein
MRRISPHTYRYDQAVTGGIEWLVVAGTLRLGNASALLLDIQRNARVPAILVGIVNMNHCLGIASEFKDITDRD